MYIKHCCVCVRRQELAKMFIVLKILTWMGCCCMWVRNCKCNGCIVKRHPKCEQMSKMMQLIKRATTTTATLAVIFCVWWIAQRNKQRQLNLCFSPWYRWDTTGRENDLWKWKANDGSLVHFEMCRKCVHCNFKLNYFIWFALFLLFI